MRGASRSRRAGLAWRCGVGDERLAEGDQDVFQGCGELPGVPGTRRGTGPTTSSVITIGWTRRARNCGAMSARSASNPIMAGKIAVGSVSWSGVRRSPSGVSAETMARARCAH
jgi:hypothetical protein